MLIIPLCLHASLFKRLLDRIEELRALLVKLVICWQEDALTQALLKGLLLAHWLPSSSAACRLASV